MIWKKWNTILQLKENGKINRMGMLFSTKNKDYYYDTGTGKVVELELGYPPTNLSAAGLDNNPPQRVAYVLPRREAMLLAGRENASMYEPMAAQLQSPTEIPPPSR